MINLSNYKVGEYFAYEKMLFGNTKVYRVGLKVTEAFMIPIGLPFLQLADAENQAKYENGKLNNEPK